MSSMNQIFCPSCSTVQRLTCEGPRPQIRCHLRRSSQWHRATRFVVFGSLPSGRRYDVHAKYWRHICNGYGVDDDLPSGGGCTQSLNEPVHLLRDKYSSARDGVLPDSLGQKIQRCRPIDRRAKVRFQIAGWVGRVMFRKRGGATSSEKRDRFSVPIVVNLVVVPSNDRGTTLMEVYIPALAQCPAHFARYSANVFAPSLYEVSPRWRQRSIGICDKAVSAGKQPKVALQDIMPKRTGAALKRCGVYPVGCPNRRMSRIDTLQGVRRQLL